MRVKICGVNSPAGFDAAAEAGADWIGFVFFGQSPRHVSPAQAAALSARSAGGPGRVGLFVDPSDADVAAVLGVLRLDAVQLYAPAARIAEIAARFRVPVWRSVAVVAAADLPAALGPEAAAVIEPKAPAGATRPGGNAAALDFSVMAGWRPGFDWLLAGGLRPDTVAKAIAATGARAVDVSSGVESAPGIKDARLIKAFIEAARQA